jgi:hypothetical protein
MQQFSEKSEFNYQQPQMTYDKKTGDVTILDPNASKKKKIIKTFKELEQEKKRLFKEIGLKVEADPVT